MLRSFALAGLLALGTTASALAGISTAAAATSPLQSAGQSEPGCRGGLGPWQPSTLQVDDGAPRAQGAPTAADCALA